MPDWIITPASNAMDKIVSYRTVLQAMRQFVRQNAVVSDTVNIYHDAARTQRTSLRYSNNNYQVDQINGQNILYNYPDPLPDFNINTLPSGFPLQGTAVNATQKSQLLFLLPEAARSEEIQSRMEAAFSNAATIALQPLAVLVKKYSATCAVVGVNVAHPLRPLTRADYLAYANTLPPNNPDRVAILQLLG
jgi:hypothetical protein